MTPPPVNHPPCDPRRFIRVRIREVWILPVQADPHRYVLQGLPQTPPGGGWSALCLGSALYTFFLWRRLHSYFQSVLKSSLPYPPIHLRNIQWKPPVSSSHRLIFLHSVAFWSDLFLFLNFFKFSDRTALHNVLRAVLTDWLESFFFLIFLCFIINPLRIRCFVHRTEKCVRYHSAACLPAT